MQHLIDCLFKDKHGKIAVWQMPNVPLWTWIICAVLTRVVTANPYHHGFQLLGKASIITWGYLEVTSGISLFRRILGGIILAATILSFFN